MPLPQLMYYSLVSFIKKHFYLCFFSLYLGYLLMLIYRSSFVFKSIRYFSLFDDEMVSMRYAHHLAQGFGLVWNVGGPRVEGFTNPLWVIYMSLFHLLPIPLSQTSLYIQLTGAILMIATVYSVGKISGLLTKESWLAKVVGMLFTATYFPLVNWNVIQGTEVSLLTFLLTLCVYFAIKGLQQGKVYWFIYFCLGMGTLVRMDFIIPSIVIVVFLCSVDKVHRWKHLFYGASYLFIFLAGQVSLRLWYYHDVFPNTYYLKMTGYPTLLRMITGVYVTIKQLNPLLFFLTSVIVFIKNKKEYWLLVLLVMTQFFYSIYVGGDAWEFYGGTNRYTTIMMPLFFVLFAVSFTWMKEMFEKQLQTSFPRGRESKVGSPTRSGMTKMIYVMFLIVCFISFNAMSDNTFLQMFLIKAPITAPDNAYNVYVANELTHGTTKDAVIAVAWAGTIPYFTDRYFVDLLGKNDTKIGHMTSPADCSTLGILRSMVCFRPGHMKWDYAYTIGELRPDIVMQAYPMQAAKPYLDAEYVYDNKKLDMYVRKGTQNVSPDL